MNNKLIWDACLHEVSLMLNNELLYATWFKDTELIDFTNDEVTVKVPTTFHIYNIKKTYLSLIEEVFNNVTNTNVNFTFVCEDEISAPTDTPFEEVYDYKSANLNPKYNFDTFVVGDSNRKAHAISVAVCEKPGRTYNPLFIYGKSGLGKTHLMQAVGNQILTSTRLNVLYTFAQEFLEDYFEGLKNDINDFKNKYRNVDVLIIDDIQFLANKEKTQEEFFHTFNILYQQNKQIIISSDRSPDDLKYIEDRLKTRFKSGVSISLNPPDLDLRRNILNFKIKEEGYENIISDDVVNYIAHKISSDVRELEGTLRLLLANSSIYGGREIDLDFAIECLKDSSTSAKVNKVSINNIISAVCTAYNISEREIKGKSRKFEINLPRQIAMYLCRDLTDVSFQKIGLEFGNKHHSTVMSSCNKIEKLMKTDENLCKLIFNIKENL